MANHNAFIIPLMFYHFLTRAHDWLGTRRNAVLNNAYYLQDSVV
ncbi:MAG: hypothetical protein ABGX68_05590 [Methylococcales bacterium]